MRRVDFGIGVLAGGDELQKAVELSVRQEIFAEWEPAGLEFGFVAFEIKFATNGGVVEAGVGLTVGVGVEGAFGAAAK